VVFSDHSVFLEENQLSLTILIRVKGKPFLHVVFPIAFVSGAISVVKDSISLSDTIYPRPFVSVSNVFSLPFGLEPDMHAPAFLMVVFPLANVLLSDICPVHSAFTLFFVVLPFAFEKIARRIIVHFSMTLFEILLERSLKYASAFENNFAFARLFPLEPLAFVCSFFNGVFSKSMPEPVLYLALINASVRPSIDAMP
jgi:hypothetical protein